MYTFSSFRTISKINSTQVEQLTLDPLYTHAAVASPSQPEPALNQLHEEKEKRETFNNVEQIFRTKGLTSEDRSNKATLPLTVPRSHSSRLQRIHPRIYNDYNT